jgi:hypothetical protein
LAVKAERAIGWLAVLVPALFACAAARCDSTWGFVAARNNERFTQGISVPDALSASAIRLISSPHPQPASTAPKPVAAFDLGSLLRSREDGGYADPIAAEAAIPADALWPDAGNVIAVPRNAGKGRMAAAGLRNPWEIRNAPGAGASDFPVACGGVIIGGEGGPAAIVNGRLVRRGDRVDRFNVAAIRRGEVLLEQGGIVLVLPRGRPVTIRIDRS